MLPVYLRIKDFISHKESVIDFTKLDNVTLIVGINNGDPKKSNGAGKSSLFDAITWALFEKCRISRSKGTGLDNVVRHGARKAEVEFHFKLGEQLYRVVRSRDAEKRKSDLVFQVRGATRWESVGMDKKSESNAKIAEIIGINYEVFLRSVLLEQHDTNGFADLTPSGRKDVVSQILQLDHYDRYQQYVKGQLDKIDLDLLQSDAFLQQNATAFQEKADAEAELQLVDQRIAVSLKHEQVLKALVEQVRATLNEEQKKVYGYESLVRRKKELGERLYTITLRMRDWTGRVQKREEEQRGLEVLAREMYDKLMDLKENRGDPEKIKRALERAREAKQKIDDEYTDISVTVKTLLEKAQDAQDEIERIEVLNEGECPTCYSAVTADSKTEALNKLKGRLDKVKELLGVHRSKLKEATDQRKAIEIELTKAEGARDHYNNSNREAKVLKAQWDTTRQQLIAVTQQITDANQEKQMNKEELDKTQNEMAHTLEELQKYEDFDDVAFKELQAQIGEKVAELESAQKTLSIVQIKKGQLQERIQAKTNIVRKIEESKTGRAKLDHERRVLKELIQAFGKTGIQALILENSAIEIEKIANNLLGKITDDKVSIEIITQKENKDGSIAEAFDIIITDEFHSSPFNMYSMAGDESVIVKDHKGHIKTAAIEDLWDISHETIVLDEKNSLESQLTKYVPLGCNREGKVSFEPALALIRHKAPEYMYRITSNPGNYKVNLTGAHSVYVLTPEGLISKRVADVQVGDLVLTPKTVPSTSNTKKIDLLDYIDAGEFTNKLQHNNDSIWLKRNHKIKRFVRVDKQLGTLLGWAVAEGSATPDSLWFSLGDEKKEANQIAKLIQHCFNYSGASVQHITAAQIKGANVDQYRVECGSNLLSHVFKSMIGESCYVKRVPEFIFNASIQCQQAFIRGLQAGDGGVTQISKWSRDEQFISSSSKRLINDIILLLRQLRINARAEEYDGNYKVVWQESLKTDRWAGIPVELFDRKHFKYVRYVNGDRKHFQVEEAESIWLTRPKNLDKILAIVKQWNILTITNIEQVKSTSDYVYDFSVPNGESFIGGLGGLLLHNSGGEKFRIAFVIRIALSTLLARRSGVKIPAIFYDEAFQDLDADGVDKLMEIFAELSKEFRYQLVITHQTELKSQFNDVITVVKTKDGSTIKTEG